MRIDCDDAKVERLAAVFGPVRAHPGRQDPGPPETPPGITDPGRFLRTLRRGLGISQTALAVTSGVPRSLIERVEDHGDVRLSSLLRLYRALGCELRFLPFSVELGRRFSQEAAGRERRRAEYVRIVAETRAARPDFPARPAGPARSDKKPPPPGGEGGS